MLRQHRLTWRTCQKCPLHKTRQKTCLHRGSKRATVLVIGDAPSPTDDTVGTPFSAEPGQIMDQMLTLAGFSLAERAYTTVVACYPEDEKGRYRDPKQSEILRCWPRLLELMKIVKPHLIVTTGVIAAKTMSLCGEDLVIDGVQPMVVGVTSPAQIVRSGGVDSISYSYAVVTLKNARQSLEWKGRLDGRVRDLPSNS